MLELHSAKQITAQYPLELRLERLAWLPALLALYQPQPEPPRRPALEHRLELELKQRLELHLKPGPLLEKLPQHLQESPIDPESLPEQRLQAGLQAQAQVLRQDGDSLLR